MSTKFMQLLINHMPLKTMLL